MIKYICFGGLVVSKFDRQRHYITALEVCCLYGVNPKYCIFGEKIEAYDKGFINKLIELRPRRDGNYTLKNTGEHI